MPLGPPPAAAGSLADLPRRRIAGARLYRVWCHDLAGGAIRRAPWWFASAERDAPNGGRFDLPEPMGTCYFATRPEAAVLEALQARLTNLPIAELEVRRLACVTPPDDAPSAAMLTARRVAGRYAITAELWAGPERAKSRAWAGALRRDGWWALYTGIAHDPAGRLRAVSLFDLTGAHPPSHGDRWRWIGQRIADDQSLAAALRRYDVAVRAPGQLPWARPR